MRFTAMAATAGFVIGAIVLAGCSGTSKPSPKGTGTQKPHGSVVKGGTFVYALPADPGNLDVQEGDTTILQEFSQFAYDPLVSIDTKGTIHSALASSWKVSGTTVTMTLNKAVKCSDGAAFTAKDAAANLNFLGDPKNKSPFTGTYLPAGSTATGDASSGTVTLTTPAPAPFVLAGLANVPMICAKGLANRKLLAGSTDGTGPFRLTSARPNDVYTLTVHRGYTWGPNGASTATAGTPSTVKIKIVPNETTAANLLLSGGLNAASVTGADQARVDNAGLFSTSTATLAGEMWFNHATGLPGADPSVRQALTHAVDLGQLAKVYTSGHGTPATTFAVVDPVSCPGNSVAAALPKHGIALAKQALDAGGWKAGGNGTRTKNGKTLAIKLVYDTTGGSGVSAAAELAQKVWRSIGVKVTLRGLDHSALEQTTNTGDFDVLWIELNVSSPDQLVPFLSGPAPSKGNNFAHVNNPAYTAQVTQAGKTVGQPGCATWLKAEADLVRDADVIPFANQVVKTFGNHASFEINGFLVPTSIRMRSA